MIWKPGPLAQMAEGGAESLDQTRKDELWLRDQFVDSKCGPEQLEKFALARGLKRLPSESAEVWQARVVNAWFFWKLGGTLPGMRGLLAAYCDDAQITESGDGWAEFRVSINLSVGLPDATHLIDIINEIKPARSRLASLALASRGEVGALGLAMAAVTGAQSNIREKIRENAATLLPLACGAVFFSGLVTSVAESYRTSLITAPSGFGAAVSASIRTQAQADNIGVTGAELWHGMTAQTRITTYIGG